jgi:AcrR family transcriptional regulator
VSERSRPYHHGDLRAELVAQALELARADPDGLSLREVTRRAGVSPAAAYRHFRDRSALLAALATEIQLRMAERMRPGAQEADDPAQRALLRLRAVGLGYIGFAVEEPGWFELAFFGGTESGGSLRALGEPAATSGADGQAAVGDAVESGESAVQAVDPSAMPAVQGSRADGGLGPAPLGEVSPFAELLGALDECVAAGALTADRRAGAEFSCWSAVHGCAELIVHGPLRSAPSHAVRQVAERVVDDIITGIR